VKKTGITVVIYFLFWQICYCQNKVKALKINEVEAILANKTDHIIVLNMWATWCKPCVAELPQFERFFKENTNKNVKLLLLSVDFPKDLPKVQAFVNKKAINCPVALLNETNPNAYIDKISEQWDGTLPSTLFVNTQNGKRLLVQQELNYQGITNYLSKIL
jgi:thiol-disulfide isomerase/thioredoxin